MARTHIAASRVSAALCAAVLVLGLTAEIAGSTTITLPKPGTAAQVAKLVAASATITKLPKDLDPALTKIVTDTMANTTLRASKDGCAFVSAACTYGDRTAKKIVVLFGDSHAWMWLAAVNPILVKEHYRLQLLWIPSCPDADLGTAPDIGCATWRSKTIAFIRSEKPVLTILSERTSNVFVNGSALVTAAEWTAGEESTISQLRTSTSKVVVIGDIPVFVPPNGPTVCLSANPTHVQDCAIPLHNPIGAWADFESSEKTAAAADHAGFIDPTPWLCVRTSCAAVIGTMVVHFDWAHISATYSAYLSTVMGAKILLYL